MSVRRFKPVTLLAILAASALTLLAWTQSWFTVIISEAGASKSVISIAGSTAAPALSALSIAGFALVAALAISGPILRTLFGVLEGAIGVGVVVSSLIAVTSPIAASTASITKATGLSGTASVTHLVSSVAQSGWPWCAVAFGAVSALLGMVVIVTTRRWPGSTTRYQAVPSDENPESSSRVSDWDQLSGGSDPTSR